LQSQFPMPRMPAGSTPFWWLGIMMPSCAYMHNYSLPLPLSPYFMSCSANGNSFGIGLSKNQNNVVRSQIWGGPEKANRLDEGKGKGEHIHLLRALLPVYASSVFAHRFQLILANVGKSTRPVGLKPIKSWKCLELMLSFVPIPLPPPPPCQLNSLGQLASGTRGSCPLA
jgi:hypothetical protein